MTRILAFLLALAPALAGAVQLTLDLTGPGLYPAGTEFQSVRLYSVRAGSDATMELRGFRPLTLTRSFLDSASVAVDVPASPDGQAYRLWVNGESIDFVMPSDPASLSAILQAQASRQPTGPVTISPTPPPDPSPGDIAFDPTGLTPGAYAPGLNIRQGGAWHQISGGRGSAAPGLGNDVIVASTFQYSEDTSSLVWENPEGTPDSAGIYEGICADVLGTGAAGKVLHWKETGQGRKPICEWETDDTAQAGTGLDAAGVRDQVSSQLQAGDNISLTPAGSGAAQTLTIAGPDPYNDELAQARLRSLESFEGALRRTRALGSQLSLYAATSNAAVQIPGVVLPTAPLDQRLLFSIESSNPDDRVISLATLRGKNAVNTAGTQLDDANSLALPALGGIVYRVAHDGDRLWIAPDTIIAQQDAVTVDVSIDEPNFEPAAYASGTGSQFPPARLGTGARDGSKFLRDDGAWEEPPPMADADVKASYERNADTNAFDDDEQTKLSRYPADCPDGEVVKGAGTGQPFTCETDATATGGEAQNAAIDARIKPPARLGNTTRFGRADLPSDVAYGPHFQLTPQQDAALSIFTGTEGWVASTSIQVSMDIQATKPTASDAQGKVFVAEQVVGPRQTNAWIVVRVPVAAYPVVDDDRARVRLWETSRTVGAPEADAWELLVQTAAYRYYVEQFADFPSGAKYRAEEHDDVELIPNRIDLDEWRRDIVGHLGQTFAQQSPGVSPSPTSTSQLVATATALSPTLDLDDAAAQHGEFHISLELEMTQAHSTVSFTLNQPSPGEEDRQRTLSVIVYASDLRDEGDFTTSNLEGLVLFEVPVYAASTRQGRYWLLLVHDSNNEVALYRHWTGEAGSSAMTISAEARITFIPSDTPSLGALGGLTEGEVDNRILPPARTGNATAWSTAKAPGRDTDLSLGTRTGSAVPIRSSTGTGTQIPPATQSRAGVMSAADKTKLDRYPAQPASGGGGLSLTDKDAALPAASGSTSTVGHHTNRKVVATNSSRVEISDWGDLTLTTDATAAAGMTIANNRFVFATAGKIWMEGIFEITQPATGGASRSYNDFRGELVRGASTTHPMKLWSSTCYTKTTAPGTADGSVGQGPRRQRCNFLWMYEVEANDEIGVEWYAHSQSNAGTPQTAIDITQGALSVRLAH